MFLYQPLEQFEVVVLSKPIWFLMFEVLFTNTVFFSVMVIILVLFFMIFLWRINFIPTNIQILFEELYKFIVNLIIDQSGKKGIAYFGFIFTLFLFILLSNILGLLPVSFTLTSHILVTFTLGFSIIVGLTIIGFKEQKLHFLDLFIPKDVHPFLVPILIIIEVISYVSRGFSLSIRLFANIMAGHTLLNILSTFTIIGASQSKVCFFVGLFIVVLVGFLEFALALLQAYVFTVLTCIYLNDALNSVSH